MTPEREYYPCAVCQVEQLDTSEVEDGYDTCTQCLSRAPRHLCPGCAEVVSEHGQHCDRCVEKSRRFDQSDWADWGDLRPWMSGPQ